MGNGLLGAGHEADQPLRVGDVHEAVAHPGAAHDLVRDLVHEVEGGLDAVFVGGGPAHQGSRHRVLVVLQDVEGVGGREHQVRPILRPDHQLRHDVNPSDEPILRPVVEADEVSSADTDEAAAVQLVHDERRLEGEALFEILEHCDLASARVVACCVSTRGAPDKLQRLPEGLVTQCLSSVDHELTVAAYSKKPTVGMVGDVLGEYLGCAHVLYAQGNALTIPWRDPFIKQLQVCGLDFIALCKNDLAAVH
mmetsp:Transcript_117690/g.344693  ORF Transcript_117690/g.344693 Transcript_117690/m.344693 type:complete len:251 (-) Transcript_117690:1041-1793(-)